MENHQISEVDSHKHLGLYFSHDCIWHQHINHITVKAWTRINIMRKLKFKLDRKSLETIYTAFIRPLIEYGDIIWNNCSQYEKDELEKIQNEAARIATGATRLVSLSTLRKEIGWESLEKRRPNHKLTLFYKMTHNLGPLYLSSLVPSTVSNISHYNLRNSNNLQTIAVRTTLYYNSFLSSTVRAWNEVPEEVKLSDSVNAFKRFVKKDKSHIPKHFYVGKRKAQILHTRLRANCSSLNLDLFMRNISYTPLCQCGSVENAQHFFFHCRNYYAPRTDSLIQYLSIRLPRYLSFYMAMTLFRSKRIRLYSKRYINSFWIQSVFE